MRRLILYFVIVVIVAGTVLGCTERNSSAVRQSSVDSVSNNSGLIQSSPLKEDKDRRLAWQKPEFVIDKLGDLRDKVVADIGAGTGYFTFRLVNKAEKVIAVDIDTNSIQWINSFRASMDTTLQKKVETRLATPDNPRLGKEEVDVAIIINTIGYIGDRQTYLRNLKNSLKPGGLLMIVDFKMKRIDGNIAPSPENRVSILELENDLENAGYLHIETDDTSLDYQYIILSRV